MNFKKMAVLCTLALATAVPSMSHAEVDWVVGNVVLIEDLRGHYPEKGILVNLTGKTYYGTGGTVPTVCIERFFIKVGVENVDAEMQKNFMSILLAARLTGEKVRLLVNPDAAQSGGFCPVRAISIGEV